MNDFGTILDRQKNEVYESMRQAWFVTPQVTSYDGLSRILDVVYFEDGSPQLKDPEIVKVVYKLLNLKTHTNYRIKDIYDLITDDQLYSALTYAGINHAYFMCAVYLWVYKTAGFETKLLVDVVGDWSGELCEDTCQDVFNSVSHILIRKLELFYE